MADCYLEHTFRDACIYLRTHQWGVAIEEEDEEDEEGEGEKIQEKEKEARGHIGTLPNMKYSMN